MLKLRPIGPHDYSVFEDGQRIGRIRFAGERQPLKARTSPEDLAAAYKAMNIRDDD